MRGSLPYIYLPAIFLVLTPPTLARAQNHPASAPEAARAASQESTEDLDQKAKRLFLAGKFAEAIEILTRLYAETSNPIYLRNIGRSYQRLREPDRAIASFEEYLLRATGLSKNERNEVRSFIREMEDLRRRQASDASRPAGESAKPRSIPPVAAASPPPAEAGRTKTPGPAAPAISSPVPLATAPAAAAVPPPLEVGPSTAPPPLQTAAFTAPPVTPPADAGLTAQPARPVARTMAVVAMGLAGALAVTGGIAWASSWSRNNSAKKGCLLSLSCGADADAVERRITISRILLIGAAVTGAAGVTVYLLNPGGTARPASGGLALGLGGRF